MLKKKLYTSLVLLLCFGMVPDIQAQISLSIPELNIINREEYRAEAIPAGNFSRLLGLAPSVWIKANHPNFLSLDHNTLPVGYVATELYSIGGISLLGLGREVPLTTDFQVLYGELVSLLNVSGSVRMNFRIQTDGHTWIAGTYTAPLEFRTRGVLNITNQISPNPQNLSINVPAFITPQASIGEINLQVNDLNVYRTTEGVNLNQNIAVSGTVPYSIQLKADQQEFSFSTDFPYNSLPMTAADNVNVALEGIPTATSIWLSAISQSLTNQIGISIPNQNNHTLDVAFGIGGMQLKQQFKQAGSYSLPLTFNWQALSGSSAEAVRNGVLRVTVSDLSELTVNQNSISLDFNSSLDYQQGVTQVFPNHLTLSKTTPYSLYIRAASDRFVSGSNTIPIGVLKVGLEEGESGMGMVVLSTAPQKLLDAADPVIDRNLEVQYTISAEDTPDLLGKPAGTYSADIIYSFVAL